MRITPVRFKAVVTGLVVGMMATSAFAGNKDLVRICDSARLSASERKECRAQFKAATDDAARLVAFRTFDEKINGSASGGK
jgi:hypothetical protein